jgi:hypothetical protein
LQLEQNVQMEGVLKLTELDDWKVKDVNMAYGYFSTLAKNVTNKN